MRRNIIRARAFATTSALALITSLLWMPFLGTATADTAGVSNLPVLDPLERSEDPLDNETWKALNWASSMTEREPGVVTEEGWRPYDAFSMINGAYWSTATFKSGGNGAGAAMTMVTAPGISDRYLGIWLNMPEPGAAKSGYRASWTWSEKGGNLYDVELSRWVEGEKTVLDSEAEVSIPVGSTIAISAIGETLTMWKGVEDLDEILSGKDSTYTSGHAGLEGSGNISRVTNFKAGNLIPPQELCVSGQDVFAGACWQKSAHSAETATGAAESCAAQGGELPEALALAAYAKETGVDLDKKGEWSSDITSFSGENVFAVITVGDEEGIEIDAAANSNTRSYRCVFPYKAN